MQCPLCGYEFDADQMACHTSCAFNKACAVICCPNCGYQMVDDSKSQLAGWIRKHFERSTTVDDNQLQPQAVVALLSAVLPGQVCKVVSMDDCTPIRRERLSVFGLMPGAELTLRQRRPTFVLSIGFTELSIEREIADGILVETLV